MYESCELIRNVCIHPLHRKQEGLDFKLKLWMDAGSLWCIVCVRADQRTFIQAAGRRGSEKFFRYTSANLCIVAAERVTMEVTILKWNSGESEMRLSCLTVHGTYLRWVSAYFSMSKSIYLEVTGNIKLQINTVWDCHSSCPVIADTFSTDLLNTDKNCRQTESTERVLFLLHALSCNCFKNR